MTGQIKVGVGGWTYEPWRGLFYPEGLTQKRELEFASRQLTAIEINGTFYGSQKPESFRKWRDETPDGFVFSLKAPRFATNRRVLAEAAPSIEKFFDSGVAELGDKLGPILWQFAATKKFDPEDFEAFLKLLPADAHGRKLNHVLDVRHDSFMNPNYLALATKYGAATVFTDSDDYPSFSDVTGGIVYVRAMRTEPDVETGYKPADLDKWAVRAKAWAGGGQPDDTPRVEDKAPAKTARDVFIYFISGAKERAPAAAMGLIERLKRG